MNRRDFGKLILSAAGASLVVRDSQVNQQYQTPQQIAAALHNLGIESKIYDHGGNRTILAIGELHLAQNAKVYPPFIRSILGRNEENPGAVHLARIYMEHMYAGDSTSSWGKLVRAVGLVQDSYHQRRNDMVGIASIVSHGLHNVKPIESDYHGYNELSDAITLVGIDDPELFRDSLRVHGIRRLAQTMYPTGVIRSILAAGKIKQSKLNVITLANALETIALDVAENDLSPDNIGNFVTSALESEGMLMVEKRNKYFTSALNTDLRPYEVGGLIIGDGHLDTALLDEEIPSVSKYPSLIDRLKPTGINVVYITPEQIYAFYDSTLAK